MQNKSTHSGGRSASHSQHSHNARPSGGRSFRAPGSASHGSSRPSNGGYSSHGGPARRAPGSSGRFTGSGARKPSFSRGGSSSHSSRPSTGGAQRSGGFSRGGNSGGRSGGFRGGNSGGGRGKGRSERIDVSKFINKVTTVEVEEVFKPKHQFADFNVDARLKAAIAVKGYVTPTPIQDGAIPKILEGKDIVGIANTGTGKTAAFLIPLIHKVLTDAKQQVIVVVPTRELAIQIDDELRSLTKGLKIFSVCCVGGAPIGKQISQLKYKNSFIIGTPGRLKDLIARKMIHLNEFQSIVLDEADQMLDMGFIADMRFIMDGMPKERHTLFFSATLSPDIEKLINDFLNQPVRISVKTRDTAKNVEQDVVRLARGEDKLDVLHELLNQPELKKVLIFGKTKHGVEKLSKMLVQRGFKSESIHGDKRHSQRQNALRLFKDSHVQILVATDVAARGLDIPNVSHVINYDVPATYDDYVHRIGRTGRGDKKGIALTLIG
jgi:ATP-dependent RNA helicase RhlE